MNFQKHHRIAAGSSPSSNASASGRLCSKRSGSYRVEIFSIAEPTDSGTPKQPT
jgi:hypothetical protein